MKGGVAGGSYSGKRRWKGLVVGVLGLVFLSMLVPLLFLLGLHNGFHPPGYVAEQRNSPSIGGYGTKIIINASILSGGGGSKHVDDFVKNFTPTLSKNSKAGDSAQIIDYAKGGVDQSGKSCELKFGSYCLWSEQHREDMKDAMVKRLKDQLFVARAYFPSIAKLPSQDKLSRELRQNIQEEAPLRFSLLISQITSLSSIPPTVFDS